MIRRLARGAGNGLAYFAGIGLLAGVVSAGHWWPRLPYSVQVGVVGVLLLGGIAAIPLLIAWQSGGHR